MCIYKSTKKKVKFFSWTAFNSAAPETCSPAWQLEKGRRTGKRGGGAGAGGCPLPAGCDFTTSSLAQAKNFHPVPCRAKKPGNKINPKQTQKPDWANNNTPLPQKNKPTSQQQQAKQKPNPTSKQGRRPLLEIKKTPKKKTPTHRVLEKRIDSFPRKCEVNGPVVCVKGFKISFI